MSSRADARRGDTGRRPGAARDAGFTLIEVLVCLGILGVIAAAVVPQLITGLRSNDVAKVFSQAKGVAQSQTEEMRNLPFYVAPEAGDYLDVLDRYYRGVAADLAAPTVSCGTRGSWTVPTASWSGYVAPSGSKCSWEPAAPFYRNVQLKGDFAVVTDTRFLSDSTPPVAVTAPVDYDSRVTGKAKPPASQLGVTVTVLPRTGTIDTPVRSTTQIGRSDRSVTRVRSSVDVAAVQMGTTTVDKAPLSVSSGLVNLVGSLSSTSDASASLSAALTGLGTGTQAGGAAATAASPPTTTVNPATALPGSLDVSCSLACWATSQVAKAFTVSSASGLPNVGSPTAPAQVKLLSTPSGLSNGLTLRAGVGAVYRPELGLTALTQGLARLSPVGLVSDDVSSGCTVAGSSLLVRSAAAGWLTTTSPGAPSDPSRVTACGTAAAGPVSVLPTVAAPDGIVRVTLQRASARCEVAGTAHTASTTYDYAATVEYWNGLSYTTVPIVKGASNDPLAAINLATTSVGGGKVLGDYVSSWSSATTASVTSSTSAGASSVRIPGVVNVVTVPVRALSATAAGPDPESSVGLSVGNVACSALDAR